MLFLPFLQQFLKLLFIDLKLAKLKLLADLNAELGVNLFVVLSSERISLHECLCSTTLGVVFDFITNSVIFNTQLFNCRLATHSHCINCKLLPFVNRSHKIRHAI